MYTSHVPGYASLCVYLSCTRVCLPVCVTFSGTRVCLPVCNPFRYPGMPPHHPLHCWQERPASPPPPVSLLGKKGTLLGPVSAGRHAGCAYPGGGEREACCADISLLFGREGGMLRRHLSPPMLYPRVRNNVDKTALRTSTRFTVGEYSHDRQHPFHCWRYPRPCASGPS